MPISRDRRRRVLADDLLNSASDESATVTGDALPGAGGMRYAPAARRENQPRLVDLVPMRPLAWVLFVGTGLIMIASLLFAHTWLSELAAYVPVASLAPFDLAGDRSLAAWVASLLLLTNMQMAVLVYSLRRHRVDDYHGRYRVWLAVALASLVTSVDLSTSVHGLLKAALAPAARWGGMQDHYGLWIGVGMIAAYLTVRLILETRRSWPTLLMFSLAVIVFGVSLSLSFGDVALILPEHALLVRCGTHLLGCLLLVTGTMLFCRHVLLDVEGKIKERKLKARKPAKPKKVKIKREDRNQESDVSSTAPKVRIDAAQKSKPHFAPRSDLDTTPKPSPLAHRVAASVATKASPPITVNDTDDDDDATSPDMRNLSRVERKRLKREAKLARRT